MTPRTSDPKATAWTEEERAEMAEQRERDNVDAFERDAHGQPIRVNLRPADALPPSCSCAGYFRLHGIHHAECEHEKRKRSETPIPELMSAVQQPHCATCICGRRAPVQETSGGEREARGVKRAYKPAGTITWDEHLEVHAKYAEKYSGQSAERIAERGGWGFYEAEMLLGRPLKTWRPNR